MTRPLRLEYPGACYHITARGDRQEPIYTDDGDRITFLDLLGKEVLQQNWVLYAFCLMDNHYHLLLETPEPNLVKGMRRLNGVYTQAFNRRHGRVGHVLQGRYKSILVDKDSYLMELTRYVVLNPLRAGMVADLRTWHWSSYLPTVGDIPSPPWLAARKVLDLFGPPETSRDTYEQFVQQGIKAPSPWRSLTGQIFLGSDAFKAALQKTMHARTPRGIPEAQVNPARVSADAILRVVGQVHGIKPALVLQRESKAAFRHAVYLLRRRANLSLQEVADMSGVSIGRVAQIQSGIERVEADGTLRQIVSQL